MSRAIIFLLFLLLPVFIKAQIPDTNNPTLHPELTNKVTIDSIKGQPISFYLENSQIGKYSKLFYRGEFAVSDENLTFSILDSIINTDNSSTRPFYFYAVNRILDITNGTLSELTGYYTLKYLTSYPCEYFELSRELNVRSDLWIYLTFYEIYFSNNPAETQNTTTTKINALVNSDCSEYVEEANSLIDSINEFVSRNR